MSILRDNLERAYLSKSVSLDELNRMVDAIVADESKNDEPFLFVWKGKDNRQMGRTDLLEAIRWMDKEIQSIRAIHRKDIDFLENWPR